MDQVPGVLRTHLPKTDNARLLQWYCFIVEEQLDAVLHDVGSIGATVDQGELVTVMANITMAARCLRRLDNEVALGATANTQ